MDKSQFLGQLFLGTHNPQAETLVKEGIKAGYRKFDTAYMYQSEEAVGKAIRFAIETGQVPRSEVFVQSKLPHGRGGYNFTLKAVESSLERMGMDYLDSYLIHYPCRDKEDWQEILLDTWSAMERLQKEGKIRNIGVSNFLNHHLDFLCKNATVKPWANQVEMHFGSRRDDVLQFCHQSGVGVMAWSPLGGGRMYHDAILIEMAKRKGVDIKCLVLSWLLKRGVQPVVGIGSSAELQELANMTAVDISEEDEEWFLSCRISNSGEHTDARFLDWIPVLPQAAKSFSLLDSSGHEFESERVYRFLNLIPIFSIRRRNGKSDYKLAGIPILTARDRTLKKRIRGIKGAKFVFRDGNRFLECPVWDSNNGFVYCVAEYDGFIYRVNPDNGEFSVLKGVPPIGCVDVCKDGRLIVAMDNGVFSLDWDNGKFEYLTQLKPSCPQYFTQGKIGYNDGKLDAKGRLVVGTCSPYNNNKLYSFDGKVVKILAHNVTMSNGITWSKDSKYMYYIDTPTKKVAKYEYDIETGNASFDGYVIEMLDWTPDGMCSDENDDILIADYSGCRILRFDGNNYRCKAEYPIPANPTSICRGCGCFFVTTNIGLMRI